MRGRRYIYPIMMRRGWHGMRRFGWGWIWIMFAPLLLISFIFWPLGIILIIGLLIYYFSRKDDNNKEDNNRLPTIVYAPPPTAYPAPIPANNIQQGTSSNNTEVRYCPNCGSRIDSNFAYCPYCGYKILT
ncbi:MAG: zinc-ribbon domain-containing protein [Candidatus Asgardarchaeia archaeon]